MKKLLLILTALSLVFSTATFAKSKKANAEQFSCEDAKFHLRECGMQKLDKDRDGVPCESICG